MRWEKLGFTIRFSLDHYLSEPNCNSFNCIFAVKHFHIFPFLSIFLFDCEMNTLSCDICGSLDYFHWLLIWHFDSFYTRIFQLAINFKKNLAESWITLFMCFWLDLSLQWKKLLIMYFLQCGQDQWNRRVNQSDLVFLCRVLCSLCMNLHLLLYNLSICLRASFSLNNLKDEWLLSLVWNLTLNRPTNCCLRLRIK